jgi:hypothetical protein
MTTAFAISQTRDNLIPATCTGISKAALWTGRILSGLAAAFCLMDGTMKLFKPKFVVEATIKGGFPESTIVGIGIALLVCTVLYLIPRTSILGAILLTGYLGGAVASQVRVSADLFNVVFPVIFSSLAWGGLWLRDARLRQLVPAQRAHKFL